MKGYVYVMSNKAHKDVLKIGMTDRHPEIRVKEINSTGVLYDHVIEWHSQINHHNAMAIEKAVHTKLSACRVRANREFFKIDVHSAIKIIKIVIAEFDLARISAKCSNIPGFTRSTELTSEDRYEMEKYRSMEKYNEEASKFN